MQHFDTITKNESPFNKTWEVVVNCDYVVGRTPLFLARWVVGRVHTSMYTCVGVLPHEEILCMHRCGLGRPIWFWLGVCACACLFMCMCMCMFTSYVCVCVCVHVYVCTCELLSCYTYMCVCMSGFLSWFVPREGLHTGRTYVQGFFRGVHPRLTRSWNWHYSYHKSLTYSDCKTKN